MSITFALTVKRAKERIAHASELQSAIATVRVDDLVFLVACCERQAPAATFADRKRQIISAIDAINPADVKLLVAAIAADDIASAAGRLVARIDETRTGQRKHHGLG